jgi:hypothetical protein
MGRILNWSRVERDYKKEPSWTDGKERGKDEERQIVNETEREKFILFISTAF